MSEKLKRAGGERTEKVKFAATSVKPKSPPKDVRTPVKAPTLRTRSKNQAEHEDTKSRSENWIFPREIGELSRRRENFPYGKLEVFEKAATLHYIVTKLTADEDIDKDAPGIRVLKEHFFLIFELERLSHGT